MVNGNHMLQRFESLNYPYDGPVPEASGALERDGHCIVRGVFSASEVQALREQVLEVYQRVPAEMRNSAPNACHRRDVPLPDVQPQCAVPGRDWPRRDPRCVGAAARGRLPRDRMH